MSTTSVDNGDGTKTFTMTSVTDTFTFGANGNMVDGERTTKERTATVDSKTGKVLSTTPAKTIGAQKLSMKDAVEDFGRNNVTQFQNSVLESNTRGLLMGTLVGMGQTVYHHPVKVVSGAAIVIGGTLAMGAGAEAPGLRMVGLGMGIIGGATNTLYCGAADGPGC